MPKCLYCRKNIIRKYRLTIEDRKNIKFCNRKCYKKGIIPWNKETVGIMKPNSGSFKKGNVPNYLFKKGHPKPKNAYKFLNGINNFAWKGGETKCTQGYILVLCPEHPFRNANNYVPRARLVMEKKLGRFLKPTEVVHHINEIKTDDRIENLKLFKNNSEHIKFHSTVNKFKSK